MNQHRHPVQVARDLAACWLMTAVLILVIITVVEPRATGRFLALITAGYVEGIMGFTTAQWEPRGASCSLARSSWFPTCRTF